MITETTSTVSSQPTHYLALDVGGTKIEAGLVTSTGDVLAVSTVPSHIGGSRHQVLADIDAALDPLIADPAMGLGVGFPSFGDYDRGILESELSGFPSMDGFPLRQHLEDAFGVPTKMVPDANLFAHGILQSGEGRQFDSFIAISVGTGTAIGLVKEGRVLTGPKGFPDPTMRFYTEWGWPAAWGHSGYHFAAHYGADAETMHERALAGDSAANRAFEQVGVALADTVSRLADETGIRVAIIGGGLANTWAFIAPSMQTRTAAERISVTKTELGHQPSGPRLVISYGIRGLFH